MRKAFQLVLVAAIGGMSAVAIDHWMYKKPGTGAGVQSTPVQYANMPLSTPESNIDFTAAAEKTVHAVVHVKTKYSRQNLNNDPWGNWFWGNPEPQVQMASGSGVIISGDGYIVTNNHVVDDADNIEVTLNDKRTYTAKVIGKDKGTDLALLKIEETNLPYLLYGNSDDVKVGQWVLAVGNPFNLTSTVTAGIVSAKGRNVGIIQGDQIRGLPPLESFIQTDAAVNPGNSGGALVSTNGQLIGINSAIASNTGSYTGYSFAIPVNLVRKVVNDLIEFGEVQRAFIGVSIRDIDAGFAKEKNIKELKGVYVTGLTDNGAAASAGIKEGDIITKVGDAAVNDSPELQEQVGRFRPGDKISVTALRDGEEKTFAVTLKNRAGNVTMAEKEKFEPIRALGATFQPASAADLKKLGIDAGLQVVDLQNGKLANAGIRPGFIITSIDKKKITSKEELLGTLENKKGGVLIEGVYPNGTKAYYAFGL